MLFFFFRGNFMNEYLKEELLEKAKPLVELLRVNFHPHCKIIIDDEYVELVEGITCGRFEFEDY